MDDERVAQSTMKRKSPTTVFWGTRHTFGLLCFTGLSANYCMRVNLSVAIVAMVNQGDAQNNSTIGTECPPMEETNKTITDGEFDWTQTEQSIILGAFSYGYIVTQIPGGYLSEKFGGKWIFGIGTALNVVLTILSPIVVKFSKTLFIVTRVIQGLGQGVIFPTFNAMSANWIPFQERSFIFATVLSGAEAGTVICLSISGVLAAHFGWESIFYVWGSVGFIWCVMWTVLAYNSPREHPRILIDEKIYIEENTQSRSVTKLPPPPVKKILSSKHVIANVVTSMGNSYGFYTLLSMTPTYLNNIQHFDIQQSGFTSALPYICTVCFAALWGKVANWIVISNSLSLTNTRKLSSNIGLIGSAAGLFGLAFVECNHTLTIVFLCISCGASGAIYSGWQATCPELSPNYAGTLNGFANGSGNTMGFVSPLIVAALVEGNQTIKAWRNVYLIAGMVSLFFAFVWSIFGTAELQSWNTYWETSRTDDEPTMKSRDVVLDPK